MQETPSDITDQACIRNPAAIGGNTVLITQHWNLQ